MKATYREIPQLISNQISFTGNSLQGIKRQTQYTIVSYQTVIAVITPNKCYLNTDYYSNTTSRQQNIIKRCYPNYIAVSHKDLN